MQRHYFCRLLMPVFVIVIFISFVTPATANTSVQILEVFQGPNGANPAANLIADKSGNLYGTTEYGGPGDYYGNVFRLSPPAQPGGSWTTTILYSFKNSGDGARPTDPLLLDTAGALFGTTSDSNAGGYGEVFKLTPPSSGSGEWTETVLYSFKGTASDGAYPQGGLVADRTGNLYGTTQTSVFELSPPTSKGAGWTFTQLHAFHCCTTDGDYAFSGLVRDSQGNLYGTTEMGGFYGTDYCAGSGCGTVFEVSPPSEPGGSWTEQVLYAFKSDLAGYSDGFVPLGTLILDKAGNLYGNTMSGGALGGGTVFELSPPSASGGAWTETILHNFSYSASDDGAAPLGNLIFDEAGNLYGVTQFGGNYCLYNETPYGCGTVFKLVPSGGSWRELVLYFFENGPDVARFPGAGLLLYSNGGLFGTTQYGGDTACQSDPAVGCGLVFQLKP